MCSVGGRRARARRGTARRTTGGQPSPTTLSSSRKWALSHSLLLRSLSSSFLVATGVGIASAAIVLVAMISRRIGVAVQARERERDL